MRLQQKPANAAASAAHSAKPPVAGASNMGLKEYPLMQQPNQQDQQSDVAAAYVLFDSLPLAKPGRSCLVCASKIAIKR